MSTLSLYYNTYKSTSPSVAEQPNPRALVLIHGWGLHGGVWDDLMPSLLQHFQVTVVDLPGMGRSPVHGGAYTLDYLVDQIAAIAPPQAVWMGWSLGGMVALKMAASYPERVSAVITLACAPRFTRAPDWPLAMQPELLDEFIKIYEEDAEGTLIRFLALQCKGSDSMRKDTKILREIVYFHGIPARNALRGGLEILRDASLLTVLPTIAQPTLHIFGDQDHLVPVGMSESIKALQPHCVTAIIEGASHVPLISDPERVAQAIDEFLPDIVG